MAVPIAAIIGAASLGKGLYDAFNPPKGPGQIDISGELENIRALFAQARQAARAGIEETGGQQKRVAASDLAARGIFSSPVSENVFGEIRRNTAQQIAQSEGNLAGQEATTRAGLLQSLLGLRTQGDILRGQQDAARAGAFTSLGANLLLGSTQGGGNVTPDANSPSWWEWLRRKISGNQGLTVPQSASNIQPQQPFIMPRSRNAQVWAP